MASTLSIDANLDSAVPAEADGVPVSREPSSWVWSIVAALGSVTEWLFGMFSLIIGLAVLATVPLLQLLSLGYLLESSGRVVRSGRLRDGLVGVRMAARIGGVFLGTWLAFWPARAASGLWHSSRLLNGPTGTTRLWCAATFVIGIVTALHVMSAWLRGGRLRHFAWPAPRRLVRRLAAGGLYVEARDAFWRFVDQLQLRYLFLLGLRGAVGAMIWLVVPVTLLILASRLPVPLGVLSGLLGATALSVILLYLPFLQTRFAASNYFADLFDVRSVRRSHQQAPLAYWFALLITLALAIPLYLLKAELIPREAAWLPSLVFVIFIWPARWLTGWAVARAERRETPRHFVFRWLSRLGMLPVVLIYVLVVYFTQYVSWYGGLSLYEQHAFLVPVPFLGL